MLQQWGTHMSAQYDGGGKVSMLGRCSSGGRVPEQVHASAGVCDTRGGGTRAEACDSHCCSMQPLVT